MALDFDNKFTPKEGGDLQSSKPDATRPHKSAPSSGVWKAIAILSLIILISIGGIYAYNQNENTKNTIAQEGYQLGYQQGQLEYITIQMQTGEVYYPSNHTGNLTIEKTSFEQICGGKQ